MLSTKNLKYQIVGRRTEKLTKRFVGPYKVKKIVSLNAVELELPVREYPREQPRLRVGFHLKG